MNEKELETKAFATLTGNSGSGKSSVGRELKKRGWKEVLSFTTRPPRGDYELDEYVFLSREQFESKKALGHFLETVEYNNHYYGLTAFPPLDSNVFAIVNPVGRNEVVENSYILPHTLTTFFIDVDNTLRKDRLIKRGDSDVGVKERMADEFKPTRACNILAGQLDSDILADEIERVVGV